MGQVLGHKHKSALWINVEKTELSQCTEATMPFWYLCDWWPCCCEIKSAHNMTSHDSNLPQNIVISPSCLFCNEICDTSSPVFEKPWQEEDDALSYDLS